MNVVTGQKENIAHFEILEKLGEGGMGAVYKAKDINSDKIVALKLLSNQSIQSDELKHRFNREADAGMKLDHPCIVKIFEFGEAEGEQFISMEYVEGRTLRKLLDEGTLEPSQLCNIGIKVCEALKAAHNRGIIHRDIKSENIMLTSNGDVKVMDFGLAKVQDASILTVEGSILGTISYMSPQQAIGEEIDHRSDIFSLGVVFYEMLTGQMPFTGDYEMAVVYAILNEDPLSIREINSTVPKSLEQAIFKALRKDPKQRYQDADEFIEALQKVNKIIEGEIKIQETDEEFETEEEFLKEERGFIAKLTGRDAYLVKLKEILHKVVVGQGQLVFICGEAGIGKTRLVLELEKYSKTLKARTLKCRCLFNQGVYPYQPFVEALRSYFDIKGVDDEDKLEFFIKENAPELIHSLPVLQLVLNLKSKSTISIENKEQIWDSIYKLLLKISEERPLILFIDDLHWADNDTLNLCNYISRNSIYRRILIIGTYRPEDLELSVEGKTHKLIEMKHELSKEGILTSIELNRLLPDDIFNITQSLFPNSEFDEKFYENIYKETEGNPFFVIETLKLLKSEEMIIQSNGNYFLNDEYSKISIPTKVHDIIMRRIDRLGSDDREILEIGSVEGESFQSGTIIYCLEINRIKLLRKLQSLERDHHIIHPAEKMYRFDHGKIRDALYNAITPELRIEYHLLVADYFIETYPDDESKAAYIAQHLLNGEDENKALPFIISAADKAKLVFANNQAIEFYEKAIDIISKKTEPLSSKIIKQKQHIFEGIADVLALTGKHDSALDYYKNIKPSEETPLEELIELKWKTGNVFLSKGKNESALKIFSKAEYNIQEYLDLAKLNEKTSGKLLIDFNPEILFNFLGKIKISKAQVFKSKGDYKNAEKEINDGLTLLSEEGNFKEKGQAYNNLGNIKFDLGDYDKSREMYTKSLKFREKISDKKGVAEAYNNLAIVFCDEGDYENAAKMLEKSITIMNQIGFKVGIAGTSVNLGAVYQEQGIYEKALDTFNNCLNIAFDINNIPLKILAYSNLGSVSLDLNKFSAAADYLKKSLDLIENLKVKIYEPQTRIWYSRALLETGNIEEAKKSAFIAVQISNELDQKAQQAFAMRLLAETGFIELDLLTEENQHYKKCDEIEEQLKNAIKIFEDLKMEHESGRTFLQAAKFLAKIKRHEEAQYYLNKAIPIFQKLGAEGDLKKAEKLII